MFVRWPHAPDNFPGLTQRLGIVYCFNRPCHLALAPWLQVGAGARDEAAIEGAPLEAGFQGAAEAPAGGSYPAATLLTPGMSSAFSPRFSPDGGTLVFLSQAAAVESGAHAASASLHALTWCGAGPAPGPPHMLVGVEAGAPPAGPDPYAAFPGLYSGLIPAQPWVDADTLLLTSQWRSTTAVLAVSLSARSVQRVSPPPGPDHASWSLLAADAGGQRGWTARGVGMRGCLRVCLPIASARRPSTGHRRPGGWRLGARPPIASLRHWATSQRGPWLQPPQCATHVYRQMRTATDTFDPPPPYT